MGAVAAAAVAGGGVAAAAFVWANTGPEPDEQAAFPAPAPTAPEGECLRFTTFSDVPEDTRYEQRDCAEPDATYEVVARVAAGESCPGGNYFSLTLVDTADSESRLLCMVLNLQEGACYLFGDDGNITPASCDTPGRVLVDRRVDGQADEDLCADYPPGSAVTYPQPERTYCATVRVG